MLREDGPVKRFKRLLRQPATHVLLFCLSLVFLSWPFIGVCYLVEADTMFIYLMAIWMVIILFLFWISRSSADATEDNRRERTEG
jgi:hypothetical protein